MTPIASPAPAAPRPARARLLWRIARRSSLLQALLGPRCPQFERPVFILGSPRSGKSTLANIVAAHSNLSRHDLHRRLFNAYPAADVFNSVLVFEKSAGWPPELRLNENRPATTRLKRRLWIELRAADAGQLVSESSRYSYLIGFLSAMFPDARFIHVVRHGGEAARAMARRCRQGSLWVGQPEIWRNVASSAAQSKSCAPLLPLCQSDYERGLLVWKIDMLRAQAEAAKHLLPGQFLELRYEALLNDPAGTCEQAARFVGVEPEPPMLAQAARSVAGRSLPSGPYPAATAAIAGDLLAELGYAY